MTSDIAWTPEWAELPDIFIFQIFRYLPSSDLSSAAQTCRKWATVSQDEILWRNLFYRDFLISPTVPMAPFASSWKDEYYRLFMETPCIPTIMKTEHRDQILHVTWSHNGQYVSTCSRDTHVNVWRVDTFELCYYEAMSKYSWKCAQYSLFNASDTLLLVSGVHFGLVTTTGEIAVFGISQDGGFELQCRVKNKPYDIFGAWYDDSHILSGNLFWLGNMESSSHIYLNKAHQFPEANNTKVVLRLLKFHNLNASSIRSLTVSMCPDQLPPYCGLGTSPQHPLAQVQLPPQPVVGLPSGEGARQACVQGCSCDNQDLGVPRKSCEDVMEEGQVDCPNDWWERLSHDHCLSCDQCLRCSRSLGRSHDCGDGQSADWPVGCFDSEKVGSRDSCSSEMKEQVRTAVRDNLPQHGHQSELTSSTCCSHMPQTQSAILNSTQSSGEGGENMLSARDVPLCSGAQRLSAMHTDYEPIANPVVTGASQVVTGASQVVVNGEWEEGQGRWINVTERMYKEKIMKDRCCKQSCKSVAYNPDRFVIFTMGSTSFTPHQIGIKRLTHAETVEKINREKERRQHSDQSDGSVSSPGPGDMGYLESFDKPDTVIEMNGHVIGMCVSPDHRFLFVNVRLWPTGAIVLDPLSPPPLAQEVEIHVLDLLTFEKLDVQYRGHRAYTPNDECFFIFLDVCDKYIASGGEDLHGYLWDRHYQCLLHTYHHTNIVNAVALNPCNPQQLVTVSDDHTMTLWQSRAECRKVTQGYHIEGRKYDRDLHRCKVCHVIHRLAIDTDGNKLTVDKEREARRRLVLMYC